ncbi:MAG: response regulator transcription factor [Anaerolineae bacterium]|nr:response regulator transcription factor [Anaerolineae bacterium]
MELPEANNILIVDDEDSLRFFLSEELTGHGYRVYTAADGREALAFLENTAVDVAVIDLQMPGLNGLELMSAMQALPDSPELIMLTAHATLEISIKAMRRGCSDFLLKPCDVDELLGSVSQAMARRRQKLRQKMAARLLADSLGLDTSSPVSRTERYTAPTPTAATLAVGGLILDMEAMTATKEGQLLSLTPTEFRLLVTLMKRPNHPHTFQELAEVTHGQQVDRAEARDLLKSHIGRLRQKLGQAADGQAYIANVRGVGYKFEGG